MSPRVLIVDDERDVVELMNDALSRNIDCRLVCARNYADAHRVLQTQSVDLLVVDLRLPDGNGAELLATLRKRHPLASAIVVTGNPSVDGAITALRHGAVDFLAKPFGVDEFLRRTRNALHRQALVTKSENRIDRLRVAVRKLNEARRLVSKKVDLLCNDLVSAYGDLSRQLDLVRTSESFRGAITNSDNLEQMLCHAMDWMLRQIGYANVAVWLAGGEDDFQLGAYMKYTIPGDGPLTEAMRNGILNRIRKEDLVHLEDDEAMTQLSADELRFLRGQTVVGVHCTYLGESLACLVLFREGSKPFTEEDLATLRIISPIFGVTLATMVRQDVDEEDAESPEEDGGLMDRDEQDKPAKRRKKDDGDWWKNGEPPPF
jgi:FixJ family two-component response regulator